MARESILVLDDDPWIRSLVIKLVEARGVRVNAVSNSDDAYTCLTSGKEKPTAILTDFQMPGVDGLTFAKYLRTLIGQFCPEPSNPAQLNMWNKLTRKPNPI